MAGGGEIVRVANRPDLWDVRVSSAGLSRFSNTWVDGACGGLLYADNTAENTKRCETTIDAVVEGLGAQMRESIEGIAATWKPTEPAPILLQLKSMFLSMPFPISSEPMNLSAAIPSLQKEVTKYTKPDHQFTWLSTKSVLATSKINWCRNW
ncbi:hypothetical protein EJ08DRAFT_663770 [Tothia fuscella]|uniref:Uncharacterized protein n=1 Tax=Tothia fuscella TaxID=1048955 RepID=A0A9P4NKN2_9PEZI|nr:hypothetical protein EJ08DRAFT_663770 [Tothia fuscella]